MNNNSKNTLREFIGQLFWSPLIVAFFFAVWGAKRFFLRKPTRKSPAKPYLFVSPANGTIIGIRKYDFTGLREQSLLEPKNQFEDNAYGYVRMLADGIAAKGYVISIALNLTDVHYQRVPVDSEVAEVKYMEGSFKNALKYNNENFARYENENCQTTFVANYNGLRYKVVQIAGFVARRVECYLTPGQPVKQGEIMGVIKAGSQVSILLPEQFAITAKEGDYVTDGESIIAML